MARDKHGKKKRSPGEKEKDRQKMTSFNSTSSARELFCYYFSLGCRCPGAKSEAAEAMRARGPLRCSLLVFWTRMCAEIISGDEAQVALDAARRSPSK